MRDPRTKVAQARPAGLQKPEKTDIFLAGIGGQGVLLASEIIGEAGLSAGYDVKKSEVHGMSQRGGSVTSCVRLGKPARVRPQASDPALWTARASARRPPERPGKVYSPLIERGSADVLISLHPEEGRRYRGFLRRGGFFLEVPPDIVKKLKNPRTFNIVAVGMLSVHLGIPEKIWMDAIAASVPAKHLEENKEAFLIGKGLQARGGGPALRKEIGGRKQ
ncbi:MAG: indolepyruvate oxidoreductase subunit beta [bacterium]|nr:indolepyruvate oxidoreductase subunit beta [bacterium]